MPHGPRISDDRLRSLARERIRAGQLPLFFSHTIEAGHGSGATCCLCDERIEPQHVEYEVIDARDGRPLLFHMACHAIWQLECRALSMAQDGPAATDRDPSGGSSG